MGAGHAATSLHVDADSPLHRLPPQCKVAATGLFVVAVVATPREAWWAFALDLAVLVGLAGLGRVPLGVVARRLVLEAPFLAFALLLPLVAAGPRLDVGPLSLSESGLWGAWNILAKGTLGAFAAILLVSTTELAAILRGLERLHVPRAFTTVAGFMVRYADVVSGEMHRMAVARQSRGHDPRWIWQARAVAASAGALFVRSYERGERVYLAMVARGYDGAMPVLHDDAAPAGRWATALLAPAAAATLAALGVEPDVTPALEVRGLAFNYPDGHPALCGVDLRIEEGERVALLGPNGAGKTTLVLHLNGIHLPATGEVRVTGLPVAKPALKEIRRRVGVVFQDPDDQLFMPTVRDDVAFGPANLGLRGAELEGRVHEALAAVGMEGVADRPPHHLSFGQRRRVAVATVLAMRPDILVLDEPSSNLDPAGRRELADVLRSLDLTMLMVTHDLPYALELCSRSVVMDGGVVVADGPTPAVLGDRELMAAHRLELPFGFDPHVVAGRGSPPA